MANTENLENGTNEQTVSEEDQIEAERIKEEANAFFKGWWDIFYLLLNHQKTIGDDPLLIKCYSANWSYVMTSP